MELSELSYTLLLVLLSWALSPPIKWFIELGDSFDRLYSNMNNMKQWYTR